MATKQFYSHHKGACPPQGRRPNSYRSLVVLIYCFSPIWPALSPWQVSGPLISMISSGDDEVESNIAIRKDSGLKNNDLLRLAAVVQQAPPLLLVKLDFALSLSLSLSPILLNFPPFPPLTCALSLSQSMNQMHARSPWWVIIAPPPPPPPPPPDKSVIALASKIPKRTPLWA